jgi:hypothetical protein
MLTMQKRIEKKIGQRIPPVPPATDGNSNKKRGGKGINKKDARN